MLEQLSDEDLTRLVVQSINTTRGKILIGLRKDSNGKCFFFEAPFCQIYPQRPLSCRNYPFAFLETASGVEVTLVKNSNESCNGIGKGIAVPMADLKTIGKNTLSEIEAFRKVVEEINLEAEKGKPLRPRETVWILIAYAEKSG